MTHGCMTGDVESDYADDMVVRKMTWKLTGLYDDDVAC
jgi:hypothetical protein